MVSIIPQGRLAIVIDIPEESHFLPYEIGIIPCILSYLVWRQNYLERFVIETRKFTLETRSLAFRFKDLVA